jgi:hypothetical protein
MFRICLGALSAAIDWLCEAIVERSEHATLRRSERILSLDGAVSAETRGPNVLAFRPRQAGRKVFDRSGHFSG